jgi:predicted TPR repeat methyltransferase
MDSGQSGAVPRRSAVEGAIRSAGQSLIRGIYAVGAGVYDRLLVGALGYRAHECAVDALVRHWTDEDRGPVLDLGCGTGLTAAALKARLDVEVDGLDFSEEMLERAAERGIYRRLIRADATRPYPVPDGSYGGVVSSGLFTHAHVGAEALEPALAATRTGGLLAFTVYATIWRRGGFEGTLAELERDGRIDIVAHERAAHFTRLKGQSVHVLAIRKRR